MWLCMKRKGAQAHSVGAAVWGAAQAKVSKPAAQADYLSIWLAASQRCHAATNRGNADGLPRQQLSRYAAQGCATACIRHAAPRLGLGQPRAPGQPAQALLRHSRQEGMCDRKRQRHALPAPASQQAVAY